MKKDDTVYLLHIRDAIQRIVDYTRDGRSAFSSLQPLYFLLAGTKTAAKRKDRDERRRETTVAAKTVTIEEAQGHLDELIEKVHEERAERRKRTWLPKP